MSDAKTDTKGATAAATPRLIDRRFKLVREQTAIEFLSYRKIAAIASAALLAISLIGLLAIGLNFGIDFRGGSIVEARFAEAADVGDVRDTVNALDLGDVAVQEFGSATDLLIRVEGGGEDEETPATDRVSDALKEAYPGVTIQRTEVVGPEVSGELIQSGIIAVVLAVSAVLGYIWLRFEWQFSVGAVAALVHDVALTIGVFAIFQLEFNLSIIAAILTIVGYSLNDTVVVFDRVRENLRRYKTTALDEVLNLSINETLSRTLMTSVTTLLALLSLYILGGEIIRGFTFAMIWGVLIGTYSSIFIAAPILSYLGVTRITDEEGEGGATGAGTQFG